MSEHTRYVPPFAVERVITQWHFEGGGFVALVCSGKAPTSEMLDAIQPLIDAKRKEVEALRTSTSE